MTPFRRGVLAYLNFMLAPSYSREESAALDAFDAALPCSKDGQRAKARQCALIAFYETQNCEASDDCAS